MIRDTILAGARPFATEAERDAAIAAIIRVYQFGGLVTHDHWYEKTRIQVPPCLQDGGSPAVAIDLDFMGVYGVPFYQAIHEDALVAVYKHGMVYRSKKVPMFSWMWTMTEYYREVYSRGEDEMVDPRPADHCDCGDRLISLGEYTITNDPGSSCNDVLTADGRRFKQCRKCGGIYA